MCILVLVATILGIWERELNQESRLSKVVYKNGVKVVYVKEDTIHGVAQMMDILNTVLFTLELCFKCIAFGVLATSQVDPSTVALNP